MDVRIRTGTRADRAFVQALCVSTASANLSSLRPAPLVLAEASCERLLQMVFENPHVLFIVEADGQPAGFLIFLDFIPDEVTGSRQAFVAYTAVLEHLRGKGLGRRLLSAAEDEGRRRGLSHIALMVTDENTPALGLYEKFGYQTERRLLCKSL